MVPLYFHVPPAMVVDTNLAYASVTSNAAPHQSWLSLMKLGRASHDQHLAGKSRIVLEG